MNRSRSAIDQKALNMAQFKLRTTTMREAVLKVVHEEDKEAEHQDSFRPGYLHLTNGNSSSVSHKSFTPRDDRKKEGELGYLPEARKKSSSVRGTRPNLNTVRKSKKEKDNDSFATSEDTSTHDVWTGNKAVMTKKERVDQ